MLWGINNHSDFSNSWIFKGGTCLKKCFFETFRFSEDLDFTVTDESHLTTDFLKEKFHQITDSIYNKTGIEFFKEKFKFKVLPKINGKLSAQGVIHYNGPLRRRQAPTPNFATIKLALTTNEIVVLKPQLKKVYHPYSDEPEGGIWSICYAFEEVIAEKIRALGERARPRDLYDAVHFFRNRNMIKNPQLVYNVLIKKCAYKEIPVPTYTFIENHQKLEELNSQWHNMLAHQLPVLPPIDSFWVDLKPFFEWIEGNLQENKLESYSKPGDIIYHPGRVTNAFSLNAMIQKIQFAAANRLCIELTYNHEKRIIEPLSFKREKSGNQVFYGYDRESEYPQAFSLSEIQNVTITSLPYTEKQFLIEITAACDLTTSINK